MIDKALGLGTPKRDAYYFIFLATSIRSNNNNDATNEAKFLIYKGPQLFNSTRQPINFNWQNGQSRIQRCQLAFFLPDFNINRKIDFVIKMKQVNNGQEQDSGQFTLNSSAYIDKFMKEGMNRVEQTAQLGNYTIDYLIFTEKTRFALDKIVKQYKQALQKGEISQTVNTNNVNGSKKEEQKPNRKQQNRRSVTSSRKSQIKQENISPQPQSQVKQNQQNSLSSSKNLDRKRPSKISSLEKQRESLSPAKITKTSQNQEKSNEKKTSQKIQSKQQQQKNDQRNIKREERPVEQKQQVQIKSRGQQQIASPHLGAWHDYSQLKQSGKLSSSFTLTKVKMDQESKATYFKNNLKMFIFLLFSLFLIYNAMTPSRKVPYKKNI